MGDIWIQSKEIILGIQGHVVNDFSKAPFEVILSPSLHFGPFVLFWKIAPHFLSECPMFSHQLPLLTDHLLKWKAGVTCTVVCRCLYEATC